MDPFTMALAAAGNGINAVGKLLGAASSSTIATMQADNFRGRERLDNLNADIARMGVDFAAAKERTELNKVAEAGRQTLSAQRHYFAGGNLDPTFGSPLLVQAMTAGRVATDMDIVKANFAIDKANAQTAEAGYREQARSDLVSAQMYDMKADSDLMAGVFGAAQSLLSFGSSAAGGGGGGFGKLNLSSFGFNPISGASGG
jgi:hypothetical protein